MRCYHYLLLAGLFLLANCTTKKTATTPLDNYIILLDAGKRILAGNQEQVPKDISAVKYIYGIFKNELAAKDSTHQLSIVNDKLKLLVAPHWSYASLDLSAEQPAKKALLAEQTEKTFDILLPEIYKKAISSTAADTAADHDIWKYFNDYLADDLSKEGKNTLFIVTDGYIEVKKADSLLSSKNRFTSCTEIINALKNDSNWETTFTKADYGLLPAAAKKFTNLQVIVLQVNPREGWNGEYALLTKIWSKWLQEMGISNYHFIKNDSSRAVEQALAQLMHVQMTNATPPEQWTVVPAKDSLTRETTVVTKEKSVTKETAPHKATIPAVLAPVVSENTIAKKASSVAKKNTTSAADVLPPDESDSGLLINKKITRPGTKKTVKGDDDILQDAGAANGFNTGIRKDKKKNP